MHSRLIEMCLSISSHKIHRSPQMQDYSTWCCSFYIHGFAHVHYSAFLHVLLRVSLAWCIRVIHKSSKAVGLIPLWDYFLLRVGLHHGLWCRITEYGLYSWSNLPQSDLCKNQFTKPLGSSLGVNRMWTKKNDHAPKVNVLIFLIFVQEGQFWEKNQNQKIQKIRFDHSIVFSYLHLLFPPKNIIRILL